MTTPPRLGGPGVTRRLGAMLAGAGLLAVLLLTLVPNPRQVSASELTPLHCLVCGETGGADVFLNLLLFMPAAAGLRLLGWPWRRVVTACALLSLGVESLQHFVVRGRDASLSDLITNATGGAVAATLAARLPLLLAPPPRPARWLSLAAAAAWLGLLAFTASTIRPWAPAGRLRSYCTAAYRTGEIFSGTARALSLNGVPLACDRDVPAGARVAERLRREELTLEAHALSGDPANGRRVIAVLRAPRAPLATLVQSGRSLLFHPPSRAQSLRLFPPVVRLAGAFPERPGSPVGLRAEVRGRRIRLVAERDGGRREMELALSPAQGWTMLFPGGMEPGVVLRLAGALWLGVLLLPAAYWAGFAGRPLAALGAVGLAAIAGPGLLWPLAGYGSPHWSEWLGACGGVALGWAAHGLAAYLQSRCGSPSTSAYSSS